MGYGIENVTTSGNPLIDGLLSGVKWRGTDTGVGYQYNIGLTSPFFRSDATEHSGEKDVNFKLLNQSQRSVLNNDISRQFENVAHIEFDYGGQNTFQDIQVAFTDQLFQGEPLSYAFPPGDADSAGDVWLRNTGPNAIGEFVRGSYSYYVVIHEIGHALGLKHPHEVASGGTFGLMPSRYDSFEHTIMSYKPYEGAPEKGVLPEPWDYPQSLMMQDIAALQYMYGAQSNLLPRPTFGNTIYAWSSSTGEQFINGVSQGVPGANRVFMTIWDASGNDTYDFSNYTSNLKVDLRPGEGTVTSEDQRARLDKDEDFIRARYNIWNARLYNDNSESLIENAVGGAGSDQLWGNRASNQLTGNGGVDNFDGLEGDDTLQGGSGDDKLSGGAGTDYADYTVSPSAIIADLATTGTVVDGYGFTDRVNGDVEGIIGSKHNDKILGRNLSEVFFGSAGNDSILGAGGDDFLDGGAGNDTIVGGEGGDTASFDRAFLDYQIQTFSGEAEFLVVDRPVNGTGGIPALIGDAVSSVERLQFSDGTVKFDDKHWLFDPLFYAVRYNDVWRAQFDANEHYAQYGWREGRDPNAFFSTHGYLSANADVNAAAINPLGHYHQFGWKEGRDASVSFDTSLYLLNNADVRAAGINPLEHFLAWGRAEGRQAYAAVGIGVQGGFDAEFYLLANPDVGLASVDRALHFQNWGWKEGRDPNAFFDTSAYLATYTDVAAAKINPLEHYMQFGWKEGRDPSGAFDTSAYLAAYTDVAAANINPLEHYLKFGIYESRSSFSDGLIA